MARIRSMSVTCLLFAAATCVVVSSKESVGASFYKRGDLFAFRPKDNRKGQTIDRFGPVGIGIELTLPAFGMKIRNIEAGSPAAATGKLKKGQIIDSINGRKLADIDPRIQLGDIITEAEARDGIVRLVVRDGASARPETVTVRIPALGRYSRTWPKNCRKSDMIVRNLANYLKTNRKEFQLSHGHGPSMLFMLSTGEEEDLDVVRGWVSQLVEKYKDSKTIHCHNWTVGYSGIPLCEYYLRTGDRSVIPLIEKIADKARWDMYNDGWAHGTYQGNRDRSTARMAFPYMAGGHINACGVHVTTFLLMAKECGAYVDEPTLQKSLKHFFRFAARGNVAYGDGVPEQSFVDNGKTGGLAFTMAAAESLSRSGERSLYAQARDNSAIKGFYSTSWMLIGHTGGGVGEIWRSAAMGLMYDRNQKKYREFMDSRRWFYELSRRFDGSMGIVGGGRRYDRHDSWGIMMGLSYTMPRNKLRLAGAPRTLYSKRHSLPRRPWGNPADDAFYSNSPAVERTGRRQDLSRETFMNGSSRAAFAVMADPQIADSGLLKYAHHPDHGIRRGAASFINAHKRYHLIPELLRSKDPRVRHTGTMVVYCRFKRRPMNPDDVTDEVANLLAGMIKDPDEALWGVENALKAFALAKPDRIEKEGDRLLHWAGHEDWWLKAAAMDPLSKIVGRGDHYKRILPVVGEAVEGNTHVVLMFRAGEVFKALRSGGPEAQALGREVVAGTITRFPKATAIHRQPEKITLAHAVEYILTLTAGYAANLPGGLDAAFSAAKRREPEKALPLSGFFTKQDLRKMGPEARRAVEQYKRENPPRK